MRVTETIPAVIPSYWMQGRRGWKKPNCVFYCIPLMVHTARLRYRPHTPEGWAEKEEVMGAASIGQIKHLSTYRDTERR